LERQPVKAIEPAIAMIKSYCEASARFRIVDREQPIAKELRRWKKDDSNP
jgi:hypothetical protein